MTKSNSDCYLCDGSGFYDSPNDYEGYLYRCTNPECPASVHNEPMTPQRTRWENEALKRWPHVNAPYDPGSTLHEVNDQNETCREAFVDGAEFGSGASRVPVGVALILINEKSECLLHKRKGAHGAGTWSFPGGAIDPGEEPFQAVYRELEEEAGIVCDMPLVFELRPWVNTIFEKEDQQWITLYFIAAHAGTRPKVMEPHKNDGWAWFPIDSLPPDDELFKPLHKIRHDLRDFVHTDGHADVLTRSREIQGL